MANNWEQNVANLEQLASRFKDIERTALRQVANEIKPVLAGATPARVSPKQGGNSLPAGGLKSAIRTHVFDADDTNPARAVVDFGKYNHIADWVDRGHNAPHSRALRRAGHTISAKPTPAHPFVRSVQDSSQALAQETYESAMNAGIEEVLSGQ